TATALFVVAALVLLNVVDFVYFEPIPRDVQGLLEELGTVLEREEVRLDLERDREEMLPPYFSLTSPSALLALAVLFSVCYVLWVGLVRDAVPLLFSAR